MLAADNTDAIIRIVAIGIFLAFFLIGKVVRRVRVWGKSQIVVRDGRPVLSDKARARLERMGADITEVEAQLQKGLMADERGAVVKRPAGSDAGEPESASFWSDEKKRTEKERTFEKERFTSVWEQQDSEPSIWDDPDRDSFWGEASKRDK